MNRNVSMLAFAAAAGLFAAAAQADTSGKKIAFSNNYAGNSWRQAMLKSYGIVAKKAVADKIVAAADVFTTADKEVPTQAAQIQNLILQGYDAIVINAASPTRSTARSSRPATPASWWCHSTALSPSLAPTASSSTSRTMGRQEVAQMAQVPAQGRQSAGNSRLGGHLDRRDDSRRHRRGREGASRIQDRRSVAGDWDQTTAQKAVATVSAVAAADRRRRRSGRRRLRRGAGLCRRPQAAPDHHHGQSPGRAAWWKEQKDKDGYMTWSASIAPGVSTLAFWVAQQVLDGNKKIPHDLVVPYLAFTQDDFRSAAENSTRAASRATNIPRPTRSPRSRPT